MGQEDSPERGERMEEKRWDAYINEILSFVKFKYDHRAIRRELLEHMEDLKENLMAEGMDAPAAEYMAVEYMGDAAEIGQELNKEHHVVLGWLWRGTRALAILLVILTVVPLYSQVSGTISNMFEKYEAPEGVAEIRHIDLDREYQIYDDTLMLDKIYFYDNNTLEVVYRTKRSLLANSINWTMSVSLSAFDANGEKVSSGGGGYKKGGSYGMGYERLTLLSEYPKTLKINCADLEVTVDLETGEVTDNAET